MPTERRRWTGGHDDRCERHARAGVPWLRAGRRAVACAGAHLGHGAALLVRDPLVVATHGRADLLAARADADVGLPAILPRANRRASPAKAAGLFIGGVLLWDILVRSQLGFSVAFLEESLVAQPRPPDDEPAEAGGACGEPDARQRAQAVGRDGAGGDPRLHLLRLQRAVASGFAFAGFFATLVMMSWSLALVATGVGAALGARGGRASRGSIVFLLMPLSCVYYPRDDAAALVAAGCAGRCRRHYVFEGLRGIVLEGEIRGGDMLMAFGLNLVYLGLWLRCLPLAPRKRAPRRVAGSDGRVAAPSTAHRPRPCVPVSSS